MTRGVYHHGVPQGTPPRGIIHGIPHESLRGAHSIIVYHMAYTTRCTMGCPMGYTITAYPMRGIIHGILHESLRGAHSTILYPMRCTTHAPWDSPCMYHTPWYVSRGAPRMVVDIPWVVSGVVPRCERPNTPSLKGPFTGHLVRIAANLKEHQLVG